MFNNSGMIENAGGYIDKLLFNTGETLELQRDDIVVFVGPNNSGKSRSLNDIYRLVGDRNNYSGIVVKDATVKIENKEIFSLIREVCSKTKDGFYTFLNDYVCSDNNPPFEKNSFGRARNIFVANLTTEQRLLFSKPVESTTINGTKNHPLHYMIDNKKYVSFISKEFNKAFGYNLIPDFLYKNITLHIGDEIKLDRPYENDTERLADYQSVLSKYPQIQEQGDGMRSFASILLELCLDFRRVYLIDEPESFLHQPQARMMGRLLGENLKHNQQAFISTHNIEIIKGLLDSAKERIKIIRITRDNNSNSFKILNNNDIKNIANDSMLKHTEILSSIFYDSVVLCESDSDCLFYSSINTYLKEKAGTHSNVLFFRCGGKSGINKAAVALIGLGIRTKCIFDFDVLRDRSILEQILFTFGSDFSLIKDEYAAFCSWVSAQENSPKTKSEIVDLISEISTNKDGDYFDFNEIKRIKSIIKIDKTIWDDLKKEGIDAITSSDVKQQLSFMLKKLALLGIFILEVGEIENFVPLNKKLHSYGWVEEVFNTFPNFNDDNYEKAINFVNSLEL